MSDAIYAQNDRNTESDRFTLDKQCVIKKQGVASFFLGDEFMETTASRECVLADHLDFLRQKADAAYLEISQDDNAFRSSEKRLQDEVVFLPDIGVTIVGEQVVESNINLATTMYQNAKSKNASQESVRTLDGFKTLSVEQ